MSPLEAALRDQSHSSLTKIADRRAATLESFLAPLQVQDQAKCKRWLARGVGFLCRSVSGDREYLTITALPGLGMWKVRHHTVVSFWTSEFREAVNN